MTTEPGIPHEHIISYLQENMDENLSQEISLAKEKDVVYRLFFEFIDSIKKYGKHKKAKSKVTIETDDFTALENFLIDFWTGKIKVVESQKFLSNLMNSPLLYQRLLIKFEAVARQLRTENLTELAQVQIQSDESLLAEIYTCLKTERTHRNLLSTLIDTVGKIVDWLRRLLPMPARIPRLAFVMSVILLCLISSFAIFWLKNKGLEQQFNYADKVPFEYNGSSLRGTTNLSTNLQTSYFISQFKSGITDYLLHDYFRAIAIFESLDSVAVHFQESEGNDHLLSYIRDLYFYQGLSYFAISQESGLEKSIQEHNINLAIDFISRADSLAHQFMLEDHDREVYFLGVCHGIAEDYLSAISQLQKITPDSRFCEESQRLLKKWSKNK